MLTDGLSVGDTRKYEVLEITNGEYQVHVGGDRTGAAFCVDNDYAQFTKLNSHDIAPILLRTVPSDKLVMNPDQKNKYQLDICTNINSAGYAEEQPIDDSIFGGIVYYIPTKWDINTIQEMDKIIESFKPILPIR